MLPSFLYLATEAEVKGKAFDLPWAKNRDYVVGRDPATGELLDKPQPTYAELAELGVRGRLEPDPSIAGRRTRSTRR